MFLSAKASLQLLPSRSLLLFVLLNPVASFQHLLCSLATSSTAPPCCTASSWLPGHPTLWVSPCLTCCSLSVCFPDCSWILLCGSALGQDVVVGPPLVSGNSPSLQDLTQSGFWYIQKLIDPMSLQLWPRSLRSWLVYLLALGKPLPILLALCFLQTLVTNLVAVIFVPSTRMDALQGRFFVYCGSHST